MEHQCNMLTPAMRYAHGCTLSHRVARTRVCGRRLRVMPTLVMWSCPTLVTAYHMRYTLIEHKSVAPMHQCCLYATVMPMCNNRLVTGGVDRGSRGRVSWYVDMSRQGTPEENPSL